MSDIHCLSSAAFQLRLKCKFTCQQSALSVSAIYVTLCLKYDLTISTVGIIVMFIEHVTLHFDLYPVTYDCRRVRRSASRTRDIGLNPCSNL